MSEPFVSANLARARSGQRGHARSAEVSLKLRVDTLRGGTGPGDVEIVERKGAGHPDTICDALAERLSGALSAFYLLRFGTILHHNVDKALLVGGASRPAFGGGEVLEPFEVHLAGRAVTRVGNVEVPVETLAVEHSRQWLAEHLHALDVSRHARIHVHIRPGSVDLAQLFTRRGDGPALANDTSYGVGFAPLSPLERSVIALERKLCAAETVAREPDGGEDVKVMASRVGESVSVTVARAFIGRHLADRAAYEAAKARTRATAEAAFEGVGSELEVRVNEGDSPESIYLTVTGTSAEAGDDGEVGRGNRVNGLITPYRPMSLEAAAGKNPVSHVGKLYNLVATRAAAALCAELSQDVERAEVFLLSSIGRSVTDPRLAHVRVALRDEQRLPSLRDPIEAVLADQLASLPALRDRLVRGEIDVY